MKIEDVQNTDFTELLVVFNEARAATTGFLNTNTSYYEFLIELEGEKIFVAKINNHIAGFVSVWEQENFIHHLYVSPEYQNQGIGKSLLKECEKRYGLPLKLKCLKANKSACAFYERNGWVAKSIAEGPEGPYINYILEDT